MILVTGGAGYIGSHTNKALHNAGYDTVVVDNLCKGYENFVKWGNFENYDFGKDNIREVFEKYDIDGVIHFAAFSSVAESVEFPQKYLKNNYKNTLNLLKIMREFNVDKFILSSTFVAPVNLKYFIFNSSSLFSIISNIEVYPENSNIL